jgi:hypothetical protein
MPREVLVVTTKYYCSDDIAHPSREADEEKLPRAAWFRGSPSRRSYLCAIDLLELDGWLFAPAARGWPF